MNFYVYALVNPRTNQPFYIGKGSGDRAWTHLRGYDSKNLLKRAAIESIQNSGQIPTVKILHEFLGEKDALRLERKYIKRHGRMVLDGGILTNLILGGPTKRLKNKDEIRRCLQALCYSTEHYEILSSLLDERAQQLPKYRSIQVESSTVHKLQLWCEASGQRPMAWVVKRLTERFLAGHFSGSADDVLRENAGVEYEFQRTYTPNGWQPICCKCAKIPK